MPGEGFRTIQAWSQVSSIFRLTELDNGTKAHLILKPHLQSQVQIFFFFDKKASLHRNTMGHPELRWSFHCTLEGHESSGFQGSPPGHVIIALWVNTSASAMTCTAAPQFTVSATHIRYPSPSYPLLPPLGSSLQLTLDTKERQRDFNINSTFLYPKRR